MGDNNIRHADDICEMLRQNTTITNLVLSENKFTDKDAAMLSQVIEVWACVVNVFMLIDVC